MKFGYTGDVQFVRVPEGVDRAFVSLIGAGGGNSGSLPDPNGLGPELAPSLGGKGSFIETEISVRPGEQLTLVVGEKGASGHSLGGSDGGGTSGGGGGGLSGIFRDDGAPVAVAGGGGGSSANFFFTFPGFPALKFIGGAGGDAGLSGYEGNPGTLNGVTFSAGGGLGGNDSGTGGSGGDIAGGGGGAGAIGNAGAGGDFYNLLATTATATAGMTGSESSGGGGGGLGVNIPDPPAPITVIYPMSFPGGGGGGSFEAKGGNGGNGSTTDLGGEGGIPSFMGGKSSFGIFPNSGVPDSLRGANGGFGGGGASSIAGGGGSGYGGGSGGIGVSEEFLSLVGVLLEDLPPIEDLDEAIEELRVSLYGLGGGGGGASFTSGRLISSQDGVNSGNGEISIVFGTQNGIGNNETIEVEKIYDWTITSNSNRITVDLN